MAQSTAAMKAAAASIPAVVVGIWTQRHLSAAAAPFVDPIVASCQAATAGESSHFLLKIVPFLNCLLVPFFSEVVQTQEGAFIWINFMAAGAAWMGFQNVESSRLGARFPLHLQALYICIFQFVGISVGVPLLWLPAYFFLGLPRSFSSPSALKISRLRVWASAALTLVPLSLNLGMLAPWADKNLLALCIKTALWTPCVTPLLWLVVPVRRNSDAEAGHKAVMAVHYFDAGLAFVCHLAGVLLAAANPSLLPRLWGLFWSHEGGAVCNYFLLVDLIVFWGALVFKVLFESGAVAALLVVAATPFVGLGTPLSFYYAWRESAILALQEQGGGAEGTKSKRRKQA